MRIPAFLFSPRLFLFAAGAVLALAGPAHAADPGKLTVRVDQPGVKISPMLYGLMTEEINHSYDGGLYAELIQNRIFQDNARTPIHWSPISGDVVSLALDNTDPVSPALPTCLKVTISGVDKSLRAGIANDGFWGVPAMPNSEYKATFYAKGAADFAGPLTVDIENNDAILASAKIEKIDTKWQKYAVKLQTSPLTQSTTTNRFVITSGQKNTFFLNLVSLMPPTFNNRPNGNRIDVMNLLNDLHPAFLRFPGGNYLEGNTIAERFNWKETIGPLENRPGHQCPWGYRSSDGMGLLEYLNWCEDLKMEPVLAVFAGYALKGEVVTGTRLQPYVQDALDEIEYVTGDASTQWGGQRAKDGHPAPFKLTYVEIGNEDNFDASRSYDSRFTQFFDAIKAKYPKLQLIATAAVRTRKPDVMDDHYYRSAQAMELDVHHYDRASRTGPKIFVGEWASTEGSPTPTMQAALGDAAWLTGLERNSDLVVMSCYAPLLVNVNRGASQWGTNLIGYDALKSFGSPSYYAQRMFAQNRGDTVLPVTVVPQTSAIAVAPVNPHGGVGVGTWATNAEYKDLKVTKPDGTVLYQSDFSKGTAGWQMPSGQWAVDVDALHQSSNNTDCRATTGDPAWTDYSFTLKARKISGSEGFLILFNVKDADNYAWWNVGGWGNQRTAIEIAESGAKREAGNSTNMQLEANRWYDIRIEVAGRTYTCFLDGKQVTQATWSPLAQPEPLFATASREEASGDVIVKVVNILAAAQQIELNLQGAPAVNKTATIEVLSGDPAWVNSIAQPEKVAPKRATITDAAAKFVYEFPAHSVSVLRLKTK